MKKLLSLVLCILFVLGCCTTVLASAKTDAFTITNPYMGVNWKTVKAYKTALHSHTTVSDGHQTLKESLQRHLETGFDIVAITDHGNVDRGWADGPEKNLINTAMAIKDRNPWNVEYIGTEGTFANGVGYAYKTLANGDNVLYADNGRKILEMPLGIENNAVSVNAHVNSWFADYCDNSVTTYEDAVKGVSRAGGVCVINHPGEYTKARYELHTEDAYDESNPAYAYYINKYAHLIEKYDALIGIDMNSKGDNRTRFDRKLWDILLSRFSATGKNVFAICSSDAHNLKIIDSGFTYLLMPAFTSAAARASLESGHFFGGSHYLGNYDELKSIAGSLQKFYGKNNAVLKRVNETIAKMEDRITGIENGKYDADEAIGVEYNVVDSNGYCTAKTFPQVTRVTVDDSANTIGLTVKNALLVRFISNGKVFAVTKPANAKVDLDKYAAQLGDYVRVEVFGEGGMLYTQAFLLNAGEKAGSGKVVNGVYVNAGFIDFIFAMLKNWRDIIARILINAI